MIDTDMSSSRGSKKAKKRYRLELGFGAFLFWTAGLLVLLGWIFVLGIMVGRGDGPGFLKDFLPREQPGVPLAREAGPVSQAAIPPLNEGAEDPELRFYEELASKKAKTAKEEGKHRKDSSPVASKAAVNPASPAAAPAPMPPKEGVGYAVQVASLDTEEGAVEMVERLSGKGFRAYFTRASVNGRVYYRVRVGPFTGAVDAKRSLQELAGKEGLDGFLMETGL